MAYTKYHDPWHNANASTGGGDETTPLVAAALDWIEAGIQAAALVADGAATSAASGVSAYNQAPRSTAIASLTAWDVPVWNGSAWVRPSGTATKATFVRGDGAWAQAAPAATALPSSPVDGQLAVLTDSLSAPTYTWMFRYNASSASSYKWEFIGGAPFRHLVATAEAVSAGGGWLDLATVGPRFVTQYAGDYIAVGEAQLWSTSGTADLTQMGISAGAATPANPIANITQPLSAAYQTSPVMDRLLGVAAASDVRIRYYGANTSCTFANRTILVTPIRIG